MELFTLDNMDKQILDAIKCNNTEKYIRFWESNFAHPESNSLSKLIREKYVSGTQRGDNLKLTEKYNKLFSNKEYWLISQNDLGHLLTFKNNKFLIHKYKFNNRYETKIK